MIPLLPFRHSLYYNQDREGGTLQKGRTMNKKYFTIPTIDISDHTGWYTVVDREEGQYLGHVTTAMLEDGKTVFAVFPKGHGMGPIVLKRSDDGGRTWSDRLPVPESWSYSMECPTLFRMTDADGKKRLCLFSGGYPAHRAFSEDDGRTWSEFEDFYHGGIVFLSTMICLGPGKYLAMFHDEGRFIHGGHDLRWQVFAAGEGKDRRSSVSWLESTDGGKTWGAERKYWFVQPKSMPGDNWEKIYETESANRFPDGHFELYQIMTEDGGRTWSSPRVIVNHPKARLCEPCIVPSPDGKQLAVLMRENSRKMNSMIMFSDDLGSTWSEPAELPAALTGDRHTACYLPDGRLFITYRDMAYSSNTRGDWIAWVGTYDDLISGKEGQYHILLRRNTELYDCGYPGLEVLPDGRILTMTYGHWDEGESPYILACHLDITEVDAIYRRMTGRAL